MKFKLIVEQGKDGIFVAECPDLSGCISQGKTKEEAVKNIHNAIKGYMKCLKTYNLPFPPENNDTTDGLEEISAEKLADFYKRIGFEIDQRIAGHIYMRQLSFPHRIFTIPEYNKIGKRVLESIILQSGINISDYKNILQKVG